MAFPHGLDRRESACSAGDQIQSLVREDPLEKELATHSSILAGKSHGQRRLAVHSPWGPKRVRQDLATKQQPCRIYQRFLSAAH